MTKHYNKLVRDNIPEICIECGEKPVFSTLNDEEYREQLNIKLSEEVGEYLESGEAEELADILEVIEAIAAHKGISFESLLKIKENKADKNGKFEKRLFLKEVTY